MACTALIWHPHMPILSQICSILIKRCTLHVACSSTDAISLSLGSKKWATVLCILQIHLINSYAIMIWNGTSYTWLSAEAVNMTAVGMFTSSDFSVSNLCQFFSSK